MQVKVYRLRWLLSAVLATSTAGYSQLAMAQQGAAAAERQKQASQQQSSPVASEPSTTALSTVATTTGEVRTQSGAPVPGATVRITNTDTHKVWLSWTDEAGKFVFPQLPEGYYRVEVSQLGFKTSAIDVKLPIVPSGPIPVVLNVATLAELTLPQHAPSANNSAESKPSATAPRGAPSPLVNPSNASNQQHGNRQGNQQGDQQANSQSNQQAGQANNRQGQGQGGQGGFGGRNGRVQLPAGVTNAIREGMTQGPFQQTDLTGAEAGAQGNENPGQTNESVNATAGVSSGNAVGAASSDSFLLQGTVGQGLAANGPGGFGGPGGLGRGEFGPGGFGPGELAPGAPGGPGGGGFGGPGGGGFGGPGGPGGGRGGEGGGRQVILGPGGGRFPGGGEGPLPGGIFAGRSRLMRQAINRMRFGLYDQYSNSALNAKPYSITGQDFPKVANYNERFGGNLGGPLKIPHIYNGIDRTYFFANYQHQLVKNGVNTFSLVPTADERSGNFCNVGNGFTLYDPNSNLSGPRMVLGNGCQIPNVNSAANGLLAFIPMPNIPEQTGPRGPTYNYLLQATTPQNTDTLNLHVLHTINSKFSLNGGYNLNSQRQDTLGNFSTIAGHSSTLSQNVNLSLNHNWSPTMVESTSVNWSRNRVQLLSDNSFVNNIAGELGIQGVSTDPMNYGIPEIEFNSLGSLNDPILSLVRNQTLRFMEGWTHIHGAHTVQFGGEVRRIELNTDSDPNPRGRFLFTGQMTSQLEANGHSLENAATQPFYEFADFLLGLPYNTQLRTGNPNTYFRNWEFITYAQDDWRVNKKFTLLFGVRYSAVTPPIELNNHISNLDLNASATAVAVVTPGQTGPFNGAYPRSLIHGDYTNFAPRIGFAWQPPTKPKTVVRGGYSIFYNDSIYSTLAQNYLAYQPPFAQSVNLYTSAAQLLTLTKGFPSSTTSGGPAILNTAGVNPFYREAYAQIWMLSMETDLRPNWILTTTYTGTKGTDLDLLRAPNRAPLGTNPFNTQTTLTIPDATSFDYDQSGANSLYNALQVRLVHRFTHGIMLQAFYTYSKSLDNASSIGGSSPIVVQQDGNYTAERGLSSFDMRHQVRLMSLYELPLGERHRFASHGWENQVFGGWRLMNMVTWHTGVPFTAYLGGGASNNTGTGANFSERVEQVGNPNEGICGGSALDFFNTGALAAPAPGTYGNERRGAIEGPCALSWNVSLAKSFRFGPRERQHHVDARWDVQNLTNTPSFSGISTTFGSPLFGQVTSAGSMRTMDFMLRFNF